MRSGRAVSTAAGALSRQVHLGLVGLLVIVGVLFGARAALATSLPDGRVTELVSQADSDGQPAVPLDGSFNVLSDDQVVYGNGDALSGPANTGYDPLYLATRGASGWTQQALIPPNPSPDDGYSFLDATPNGTIAVEQQDVVGNLGATPPTDAGSPFAILLRGSSGNWDTIVTDSTNPNDPSAADPSLFGGFSADGSEVVYSSYVTPPGLPAASYGGSPLRKVYRWTAAGTTAADGSGLDPLADCNEEVAGKTDGTVFTAGSGTDAGQNTNNVSADGRYAFVQSGSGGGAACPSSSQVYRSGPSGNTLISFGENGMAASSASTFVGATPDGSSAYFVSSSQLTSAATGTGVYGGSPINLYQWTAGANGGAVTCVSCGTVQAGALESAVVAPSGQYVYFAESGTDSSGDNANLVYVWHAGSVQLVDTVAQSADPGIPVGPLAQGGNTTNEAGNVIVFPIASGTGSDGNRAELERAVVSPAGVALTCVTCDATGGAGYGILGGQSAGTGYGASAGPVGASDVGGSNAESISADGNTIVFNSSDALTPGAVAGVAQQYRWQAGQGPALIAGTGDIGTGNQSGEVSPDGQDIFFLSGDAQTADATDGQITLYDSRVDGGFPTPASPEGCTGDGCQGVASPTPSPPVPGSTASTSGNVKPRVTPAPTMTVVRPSRGAVRGFARTGRLRLAVRVRGHGTVRIRVTARQTRKVRQIASARKRADTGSRTRSLAVSLRLSPEARGQLARTGRLAVTVTVTFPGTVARHINMTLIKEAHR